MLPLIRDLFAYQAWADAEVVRLIEATPNAKDNAEVQKLLHHMHVVFWFFVLSVQGEAPMQDELMKEQSYEEVRAGMEKIHSLADGFMPKLRESRLRDKVEVPWFKEQPNCQEALTQAVLHSQNHRGQMLTLLRKLGAESKPLDYIVWVSEGRPTPQWHTASATA
ncbi:MAG: DinB family protein [Terriglobales bacterium]